MTRTRYQDTYRRMLLDMHIPDWDEEFLAQYDPDALADAYSVAGAEGVLFYCKSHLGLNYWPVPVGAIHPAAKNRDLVGELHSALLARSIAPAAYHSVVFDNWAVENHPEWAALPISHRKGIDRPWLRGRYGTASVANPEYREYEQTQIRALLERYEFDALFLDMVFWNAVSIDEASTAAFREHTGRDIPTRLDWTDPDFLEFQSAREQWLRSFLDELVATAKDVRPEIAITHNLAFGTHGWYTGQKITGSNVDDFASGDIYGGRDEQLVISKIMQRLGRRQPAEFMTTCAVDLRRHGAVKSEHMMTVEALGTVAHAGAFLFIDAIDPRGAINLDVYRRVGRAFDHVRAFESEVGGVPIEDVGIYYSNDARVLPWESGTELADIGLDRPRGMETGKSLLPHVTAVTEAAAKLQRAHILFGIVTEDSLDALENYRVLILPDLVRINDRELQAFRRYVRHGGALYASGRTSLLNSDGTLYDDFALADVLGVHLKGHEDGQTIFTTPRSDLVAAAIHPQHHLDHGTGPHDVGYGYPQPQLALPRLSTVTDGTVHATLTLPYGYPSPGSLHGHDFASIHSSPPWEERNEPTLVESSFGEGRSFYSTAPLETYQGEAGERLFVSIVEELLGGPTTLAATAHPVVWVTGYRQPERHRVLVSALAYDTRAPFPTTSVTIRYCPAPNELVHEITEVNGARLPHRLADGIVEFTVPELATFGMWAIHTETLDAGSGSVHSPQERN